MNYSLNRVLFLSGMLFVASCEEKVDLPDNLISFSTAEQGLEGEEAEIQLNLSRAAEAEVPVTIQLTPSLLTYDKEFVTEPAASDSLISTSIPAGASSLIIKVKKKENVFLNGDENLILKISSVGSSVLSGLTTEMKLSFAAITSPGGQLTLEGKTSESNYANNVYVDLSANATTLSSRKSWNLGFYQGGQYRVVLNPGYQSSAASTGKTDINTVTLADTTTVPNLDFMPGGEGTLSLVDHWDGDLTKTALAEVSANEAENPVYLVSFEGNKAKNEWYKVKVNRNGEGYNVLFAKIGESAIQTVDIDANSAFNFSFLSLETGQLVAAEPRKANWDIQWGYSTSNSGTVPPTPYWFQDFVLINHLAGAGAAEVLTADISYEAFNDSHLEGLNVLTTRDAIGSKWRSTFPTATAGVRRDRFYVIKDPNGHYYKLKFVSMGTTADGGERGKPVIEYSLVK